MRSDTTLWVCPNCDNCWQWGSIDDPAECSECGTEMESDPKAALDTYFCNQYHQQEYGR